MFSFTELSVLSTCQQIQSEQNNSNSNQYQYFVPIVTLLYLAHTLRTHKVVEHGWHAVQIETILTKLPQNISYFATGFKTVIMHDPPSLWCQQISSPVCTGCWTSCAYVTVLLVLPFEIKTFANKVKGPPPCADYMCNGWLALTLTKDCLTLSCDCARLG